MPTILVALCLLFGLAIGSFLNVVIYRVPRKESVVSPASHCPACGSSIRARDNIPVISWLILRGRCRDCHVLIPKRYPLVELGCAALFVATAIKIGPKWDLPGQLVLVATLIALAIIDLEHLILPKRIVYPATLSVFVLLVLASAASHDWERLVVSLICALAWFLIFFAINVMSPRALGFGDVRLAPLLGLGLGWLGALYAVIGFFAANLIGALVGMALLATKRMQRSQQIPYAVFLAVGVEVAVFGGSLLQHPLHRYL